MASKANTPEVTEYIRLAQALTLAAANYAGETYSDKETNAMLAEVLTITASLQAALNTAAQRAALRPFPPVPSPPEPEPEPEPDPEAAPHAKKKGRA